MNSTFIYPLCSSSKGNATYIGSKEKGILIDAGIGIRIFSQCLQHHQIPAQAIQAIFITHEHSDHVKGLYAIAKKLSVPIYASKETLEELIEKDCIPFDADLNEIKAKTVSFADMEISSFSTPHDSAHSLGFQVKTQQDKLISLCTDLGYMPEEIYERIKGSNFVFLESNYDDAMLTYGDYPYFLKQRILSKHGHLSNHLCSETLARLLQDGTQQFILGHLSEQNNRPQLARETAINELSLLGAKQDIDFTLSVAPVRTQGEYVLL